MSLAHVENTNITHQEQLFQKAAELYTDNPGLLVVGSVGRAAIMGEGVGMYRPSGVRRDIDVVRMENRAVGRPGEEDNIDYMFEDWIADDGSYLVFPHDPSLQVPVRHPEVFRPYLRRVGDFIIPTPHHDVLGKIGTMQFIQRPKDKVATATYDEFLRRQDEHLPTELLEPFDTLRGALSQRHGYRTRGVMRDVYHRVVPEHVRRDLNLGPRLGWLRKH